MNESIALGIAAALLPVALGGVGIIIAMRVEIAILKEKVTYQGEQIRSILTKLGMTAGARDSEK